MPPERLRQALQLLGSVSVGSDGDSLNQIGQRQSGNCGIFASERLRAPKNAVATVSRAGRLAFGSVDSGPTIAQL